MSFKKFSNDKSGSASHSEPRDSRARPSEDGREGRDDDRRRDGFNRRRPRPPVDLYLDYKDPETLRSFLTESGRIVPARISRLSSKQQRALTREVKRARTLGLLPMSDRHTNSRHFERK